MINIDKSEWGQPERNTINGRITTRNVIITIMILHEELEEY